MPIEIERREIPEDESDNDSDIIADIGQAIRRLIDGDISEESEDTNRQEAKEETPESGKI